MCVTQLLPGFPLDLWLSGFTAGRFLRGATGFQCQPAGSTASLWPEVQQAPPMIVTVREAAGFSQSSSRKRWALHNFE